MEISSGTVKFVQVVIGKLCDKHGLTVEWPRGGSGTDLLNGAVISSAHAATDLPLFRTVEAEAGVYVKMGVESSEDAAELIFKLGTGEVLVDRIDLRRLESGGAGKMAHSVHLPLLGYRVEMVVKAALAAAGDERFERIVPALPSLAGRSVSMRDLQAIRPKKNRYFGRS